MRQKKRPTMLRAIVLIQFMWSRMILVAFCSNKFSSNGWKSQLICMKATYPLFCLLLLFYNVYGSNNISIEWRLFFFFERYAWWNRLILCINLFLVGRFYVCYLYIWKHSDRRLIIDNFADTQYGHIMLWSMDGIKTTVRRQLFCSFCSCIECNSKLTA